MSESEKPIIDQRVDETTNEQIWKEVRQFQAIKDGSADRIEPGCVFSVEAVKVWNEGFRLLRSIRDAADGELTEEVLKTLLESISTYQTQLENVRHTMFNVHKDTNSGQLLAIMANKISPFLPTLLEWNKKSFSLEEASEYIKEDVAGMKKTLAGIL